MQAATDQMTAWGVEPTVSYGWEFPEIGHRIGDKGRRGYLGKLMGRC